jgi:hypothetical protein
MLRPHFSSRRQQEWQGTFQEYTRAELFQPLA